MSKSENCTKMGTPPLRLRSAPSHKRETENTSKASPLGEVARSAGGVCAI